jgi:hypothetical protein
MKHSDWLLIEEQANKLLGITHTNNLLPVLDMHPSDAYQYTFYELPILFNNSYWLIAPSPEEELAKRERQEERERRWQKVLDVMQSEKAKSYSQIFNFLVEGLTQDKIATLLSEKPNTITKRVCAMRRFIRTALGIPNVLIRLPKGCGPRNPKNRKPKN